MRAGYGAQAFLLACAAALLAACAAPPTPSPPVRSYVALLRSPDGSVGRVLVQGTQGKQTIAEEGMAAPLDGSQPPQAMEPGRLQRDFAEAMAARPTLPEHFTLYFETGGTQLTPESLQLLQSILDSASRRAAVDISVTGHSDTVGKAETNEALSLKRAQLVADLLKSRGLQVDGMVVESHGERNLLVPTPDETAEPRNRRVEVSIR